jgi:hypothetical protein
VVCSKVASKRRMTAAGESGWLLRGLELALLCVLPQTSAVSLDVSSEQVKGDPKRFSADKLAVLCAERPALYLITRIVATAIVVVFMTLLINAFLSVLALVAPTSVVQVIAFLDTGDSIGDDQIAAAARLAGFPFGWPRVEIILVLSGVLIALLQLVTRALPAGQQAMRDSVTLGLPWPGRWAKAAQVTAHVRPWLITVVGLGVAITPIVAEGAPVGGDWIGVPFAIGLIVLVVWLIAFFGRVGGASLMQWIPSHVAVSGAELRDAELTVKLADQEAARLRWPAYPPVRLTAAHRVFRDPPLPQGKSRIRSAWWTGAQTSVESLAVELVTQSLVEAHELGFIVLSDFESRNSRVTASLPRTRQPEGLADLVCGRHRQGDNPARVVYDVSDLLNAVVSPDPHARVIDRALEDLEAIGAAVRVRNGWTLSVDHLAYPVKGPERDDEESVRAEVTSAELNSLRTAVARLLRRKTVTRAESKGLLKTVDGLFQLGKERYLRAHYELPSASEEAG